MERAKAIQDEHEIYQKALAILGKSYDEIAFVQMQTDLNKIQGEFTIKQEYGYLASKKEPIYVPEVKEKKLTQLEKMRQQKEELKK